MKFNVGPTGKTVKGHVLDVNKAPFERALRDYDSQLYVTWNPYKFYNYGCWEIRRKPAQYTPIYHGTVAGYSFVELKIIEVDFTNHILDCAFLNYDQLRKLKSMDTWKNPNWVRDLERMEAEHKAAHQKKLRDDLVYNMKQQKTAFRDYRDAILSGTNPAELGRFWK